jgi:hypothetical protein
VTEFVVGTNSLAGFVAKMRFDSSQSIRYVIALIEHSVLRLANSIAASTCSAFWLLTTFPDLHFIARLARQRQNPFGQAGKLRFLSLRFLGGAHV